MAKKKAEVVEEPVPVKELEPEEVKADPQLKPASFTACAPLRIRTPLSRVLRDGVVLCYVEPGADLGFLI